MWRGLIALLAALFIVGAAPLAAQADPLVPVAPEFQDEEVIDDLENPMAVRFAPPPDGRVFVAQKDGRVVVYDGPDDEDGPQTVLDLRTEVHDYWDRGLLGMALDPAWATSPYLYLLYTRDAEIGGEPPTWEEGCGEDPVAGCPVSGRLVRVRVDAMGVAGPLEPIIEDEWCSQFGSHSIGTVAFGPDGMLYVSGGEGASFYYADFGQVGNPCGDPLQEGGALRSQDVRTTGDPTGFGGAVVRIDPATGAAAPGNPLGGSRIIAYGLRNPFRFTFRPGTDEIWLGDVGWKRWEEVNRIADADDAVAENFGWPCWEGTALEPEYDAEELPLCETLTSGEVTFPAYQYEHGDHSVEGCAVASGTATSGVAFAPNGFPAAYDGALLFADFAAGCIFAMREGADGDPDPDLVGLLARRESGSAGPVELQAGGDGALYYTLFDPTDPATSSLHRITYVPVNRAPAAAIEATPATGALPLDVGFSAAGSTDPDGDDLAYAWDLDGDGEFDDASGSTAERTYAQAGKLVAGVEVTDEHGARDVATTTVWPGNTPPRPRILAPAPGATWAIGDAVELRGEAADDEDGPLAGARLDWLVTLEHCVGSTATCHTHPLESFDGTASGTTIGPEHPFPTRLVVKLTATDSAGLSADATVKVDQRDPSPSPSPSPSATPPPGGGSTGGGPAPPGEPLALKLTTPAKRMLGRRVSLLARCSHACELIPHAGLMVRGRSTRLRAAARASGRVVVTLSASARARARKAMKRRRVARVRVVVTARDAAGSLVRRTGRIRLIRGR